MNRLFASLALLSPSLAAAPAETVKKIVESYDGGPYSRGDIDFNDLI